MYLIVGTEISAQLFSEKSDKSVSLILFAEKKKGFTFLGIDTILLPSPERGKGRG